MKYNIIPLRLKGFKHIILFRGWENLRGKNEELEGFYEGPQLEAKEKIDGSMIAHVNKIAGEERLHVWKAGPLPVCGSIKDFIKGSQRKEEDAPSLS